jgi:hypothetical protein
VHPIERLRYVARANGVSPALAVRESAAAMRSFAHDPHALVTACRRMIDRQPGIAPLWWLGARLLTAPDAAVEIRNVLAELADDPTVREIEFALPADAAVVVIGWPDLVGEALLRRGDLQVFVVDAHHEGGGFAARLVQADVACEDVPVEGLAQAVACADLVVLEATAASPDECLAVSGSFAAAAAAYVLGKPVWLALGPGRLLPTNLYRALVARAGYEHEPWRHDDEPVPIELLTSIVGAQGVVDARAALRDVTCPVAPELLKDRRDID